VHYLIETPQVSFTWIGGNAKPDGDYVWLCNPDGRHVLKVKACYVKPSTPEQTEQRIRQDFSHAKSE